MTQAREGIIDTIVSNLQTIAQANDYLTNITTISRTIKSWNELLQGDSLLPYVCVFPEMSTPIYQQMYNLKMNLPIFIVAIQSATDEANKTYLLSNIITDIIECMLYDQTQGGYAIATNIVDIQTDEGDPDARDSYGLSAVAVFHFNVIYEVDTRHYTTPTFSSASIDGSTLTALWTYSSKHIDIFNTASEPSTTDFTVTGSNSGEIAVTDITISGNNITFTLESSVDTYETVELDYTSGDNPLVSYNGALEAANLSGASVTNNTDFIVSDTLETDSTGLYVYIPVNDVIDGTSVPDTSDFTLTGSVSGTIGISAVTIQSSPNRVRLTTSATIGYTETLTLSYAVGSNPIYNGDQSQSIVAFSSQSVTNNAVLDTNFKIGMYASTDSTSNGFILEYPVNLDGTSVPATTDFTLIGSVSGSATIQSVTISGDRCKVSISGTITKSQTITISYTPGENPLRDSTGTYNVDAIESHVINQWEPGFLSATNQYANNRIFMTFAEQLASTTPATSAFAITGSLAGSLTVNNVYVDGTNKLVRLDTSETFEDGETIYVIYTRPATNALASSAYSGVEADNIQYEFIADIPA